MPFPWKKARVGRISRFVADLQSPKRGGSLVVETGFPTSLIDLFVKNRDRLKKSRRRRSTVSDPAAPRPAEHHQRPESLHVLPSRTSSDSFAEIRSVDCEEEVEIVGVDGGSSVDGGGEVGGGGGPTGAGVAMAVFKMSVVVILALATKKLAVGITMSAFLLLFLEYAVKWGFGLLKPCSDAQIAIQTVFPSLFTKQKPMNTMQTPASVTLRNVSVKEIKISESQFNCPAPTEETRKIQEIQPVRPKIDMPDGERRREYMEVKGREDDREKAGEIFEALESKHGRSRSSGLKAKMKKCIPKKIRDRNWGSAKEKGTDPDSRSSSMRRDRPGSYEQEEDEGEVEERDDGNRSFRSPLLEENAGKLNEEQVTDGASCTSDIQSQSDVEAAMDKENPRKKAATASGYLVLFLTVLIGLLGGRVLALFLTLVYCLMLKLFKKPMTLLT